MTNDERVPDKQKVREILDKGFNSEDDEQVAFDLMRSYLDGSIFVSEGVSWEYILSMFLVDYNIKYQDGKQYRKYFCDGKLVDRRADQALAQDLAKALSSRIPKQEEVKLICRNCGTEKNLRNSLGELDCACGQQDMTEQKQGGVSE